MWWSEAKLPLASVGVFMELKVKGKWGEIHGGHCDHAKIAVLYFVFLLENYSVR